MSGEQDEEARRDDPRRVSSLRGLTVTDMESLRRLGITEEHLKGRFNDDQ
ncbi:hypothetical protein JD276_15215 [Leucobacter sp. CSA1]|uniref:Uncharacterized protein n=1 Tax=Leucobacter chromiisoli TaxID=2796471 RepID=A0A934UWY1_9MICO|nr:hypothetical protein [Leucobacter chromiisoli]MBK0420377.1 hypothetical protein [Leucobacter chromiisoli]